MLTQLQCQKLGIRYIDLSAESIKINSYQQELLNQIETLRTLTPRFTLPPTDDNFDNGTPGQIAIDNEYIYICNNQGIWRRIKLNE